MRWPKTTPEERFWRRVQKGDGCWIWQAATGSHGYGFINLGDRYVLAHRYSWELANGRRPGRFFVLHSCDNKKCVRPDHLRLGTSKDNVHDMMLRGLMCRGERKPFAKLTDDRVRALRADRAAGKTWSRLSLEYGVTRATAQRAADGRNWKHIT